MATAQCDFLARILSVSEMATMVTDEDITEGEINALIPIALQDVNGNVMRDVIGERVEYIDKYRQNTINGTNATFYTKDSFYRFSGDRNGDCVLDKNDITVYLFNASAQTRTEATVSTYTSNGQFVLETAPNPSDVQKIEIEYSSLPVSFDPINSNYLNAVAYGCVSLVYGRLDPQDYEKITFRGMGISRRKTALRLPGSYDAWSSRSMDFVNKVNATQLVMRTDDLARLPVHTIKSTYRGAPQYYRATGKVSKRFNQ